MGRQETYMKEQEKKRGVKKGKKLVKNKRRGNGRNTTKVAI
jgi:hypothetical protein